MAQWVKDLTLSLLWLGSLLQCGFDPWPGKFRMLQDVARKKKKKKKKERIEGSVGCIDSPFKAVTMRITRGFSSKIQLCWGR